MKNPNDAFKEKSEARGSRRPASIGQAFTRCTHSHAVGRGRPIPPLDHAYPPSGEHTTTVQGHQPSSSTTGLQRPYRVLHLHPTADGASLLRQAATEHHHHPASTGHGRPAHNYSSRILEPLPQRAATSFRLGHAQIWPACAQPRVVASPKQAPTC